MKKFNVMVKEAYEDFIQTDHLWLTISENKENFYIFKKHNKSELLLMITCNNDASLSFENDNSFNLKSGFSKIMKNNSPVSLLYADTFSKKVSFSPRRDLSFVLVKRNENKVIVFDNLSFRPPPSEPFIEDDIIIIFNGRIKEDFAVNLKNLVMKSNSFSYSLLNEISSLARLVGLKSIPLAIIDNSQHLSYKFPVKSSVKTVGLAVGMIKNKLIQFNTEKIWQIETVLHEALVNAITYGNGLDPEKPVIMNYELGIKGLRVFISDSGQGFDINNISVPVGIEALEKISGRGIYIMKKFSDALFYNKAGNEVVLFFRLN